MEIGVNNENIKFCNLFTDMYSGSELFLVERGGGVC